MKAKIESLLDNKKNLEARVVKYGKIIVTNLKAKNNFISSTVNETTLSKKTLMEKTKRLKEYEKINKNLVAQLSSYQEASEKENYNKIQEELEKKKRELKKNKR